MFKMPKSKVQKSVAYTTLLATMVALVYYPEPLIWLRDRMPGAGGNG
tara:strand:- start:525 stop:665 length:141 start_codon:yes stop_codon:yes gene_type:complete